MATIAATPIRLPLSIATRQVPVHVFDADVSRYDAVENLMKRIQDTVGGLDILVNNAGIFAIAQ